MTNVTKTLAVMEDLAIGEGKIQQQRGTGTKIDLPYTVADTIELRDLDVEAYPKARLHVGSNCVNYRYSAEATTGVKSSTAAGYWIVESNSPSLSLTSQVLVTPTDNLSRVEVFVGQVGLVYTVRTTSNASAQLYLDKDAQIPLAQNSVNNLTNVNGAITFYIDIGEYVLTVANETKYFYVDKAQALMDKHTTSETKEHNASAIITNDGRSVEQRFLDLPDEVDAAGTAAAALEAHNTDAQAHPELTAFVTEEANRATAAADAASTSGSVYATTAAGLAATASGDYFSIPSSNVEGYLELYRNSSGSAVLEKTYPSLEGVSKTLGKWKGYEYWPIRSDVIPTTIDLRGAVVDCDFKGITGHANYDPSLYYSFAEITSDNTSILFRLFGSPSQNGGNWVHMTSFSSDYHAKNLPAGGYNPDSFEPLVLEVLVNDVPVSITVIPAKMPKGGYYGSVSWYRAGLHSDVFDRDMADLGPLPRKLLALESKVSTQIGEVNTRIDTLEVPDIVTALDENVASVHAKKYLEVFAECQLEGERIEGYNYGPHYISREIEDFYVEFYIHDGTSFSGWGNLRVTKAQIDAGKPLLFKHSGGTRPDRKILIDVTKIPDEPQILSGHLSATFADKCWDKYKNTNIEAYEAGDAVEALSDRVNNLNIVSNPRLVLPSTIYAVEGQEMRLYYDAVALLPDVGEGDFQSLVDIVCSIGKMERRAFYLNPTAANVGDHSFTMRVYDNAGEVIASKSATLKVLPAQNPATAKNLVLIGDSTTDDTGVVAVQMQQSFEALGGTTPTFLGTRGTLPARHEARTGKTYGYFSKGNRAYKFTVSNFSEPDGYWYTLWSYQFEDGSGYILMNQEWGINPDGSGYIIGDVWNWGSMGQLPEGWSGTLYKKGGAGPATITVTNFETISNYSPFIDWSTGSTTPDFDYYTAKHGYGSVDVLGIDLGINDMRGAIKSDIDIDNVVNSAKSLVDALIAHNPNGKVVVGLPKSGCSTLFKPTYTTYRMNIHKLREMLIAAFDNGAYSPNVIVCPAGMMIDRYWGYPLVDGGVSPYYSTGSGKLHLDDVHPQREGYYEMGDARVGAILYAINN